MKACLLATHAVDLVEFWGKLSVVSADRMYRVTQRNLAKQLKLTRKQQYMLEGDVTGIEFVDQVT